MSGTSPRRADLLLGVLAQTKAWSMRLSRPFLVGASLIFLIGCVWAARQLGLTPATVDWIALAWLGLLAAPLSVVYAGQGLVLLARSAGTTMPFGRATAIAAGATLAEVLPLPGGAIVRAGALIQAGAKPARSTMSVLTTAVLWIGLAAFASGLVLARGWGDGALALAAAGAAGTIGPLAWLASSAGWANALGTLTHRLAGLSLLTVRLHLAFLALGSDVAMVEVVPFVLAVIAGSAASIAPAGLGISEALAALLAGTVGIDPASAFLAVAIDRIVLLAASASAVAVGAARRRQGLPR